MSELIIDIVAFNSIIEIKRYCNGKISAQKWADVRKAHEERIFMSLKGFSFELFLKTQINWWIFMNLSEKCKNYTQKLTV